MPSGGYNGVTDRRRRAVKGYVVVGSDGQRIGRVSSAIGGFVVVERGRLMRTRLALPREFAHTTDGDRKVAVTAPRALLEQAPRVRRGGAFDASATARQFGVASKGVTNGAEEARAPDRRAAQAGVQGNGPEEEGKAPLTKQPPMDEV